MTRTRVTHELREKARSLRHRLTKGEVLLWLELRDLRAEGMHFRKQSPIGPYIADFVCHLAKLIVEVDGDFHETDAGRRHDVVRDAYLTGLRYRVLRLDEPDVLANPWHCGQLAREAVLLATDPTRPLRGHPPLEGEGASAPPEPKEARP